MNNKFISFINNKLGRSVLQDKGDQNPIKIESPWLFSSLWTFNLVLSHWLIGAILPQLENPEDAWSLEDILALLLKPYLLFIVLVVGMVIARLVRPELAYSRPFRRADKILIQYWFVMMCIAMPIWRDVYRESWTSNPPPFIAPSQILQFWFRST